ncbi:MAG: hypothetical protein M5U19_04945 [Microthrixaceae bacterium]|nr:hypothetical protein [Microthrixaceae bacterium]
MEALFVLDDTEWAIRRVVPASGRSRSYLNGELVTANQLADLTDGLLEDPRPAFPAGAVGPTPPA